MKRRRKQLGVVSLVFALVAGLVWQFTPLQAILAIASLSDPAKLATLGKRGANPRLNKIVYWLDAGRERGLAAAGTVVWAQRVNGAEGARALLVRDSLLRNLRIAEQLGLLTEANRVRLRSGDAGVITLGPYAGETVEIDHVVPISLAPELGNELANLEMLPRSLNRSKSNRVGARQLDVAEDFFEAGLLTPDSMARLKDAARRR
jgi:hypothetical protein